MGLPDLDRQDNTGQPTRHCHNRQHKKEAVVTDVAVPSDSNIKKKEYEKLEKYQGLKEELERTWKVKVKVVPLMLGALGALTP